MMKLRKLAATLIAALTIGTAAMTAAVPPSATVADGYYVTTANSFLSLRAGAGTNFRELDRLGKYTSVRVDEIAGDWAYVFVPSRNEYGYVYMGYLTPDGNSGYNNGSVKTCCVKESYLALRTAPSFQRENEIGKIWAGQTVNVQWYTNNGYAYVYAPTLGMNGYVNASFIR